MLKHVIQIRDEGYVEKELRIGKYRSSFLLFFCLALFVIEPPIGKCPKQKQSFPRIVLCGGKHDDLNENINMKNPSVDRKLSFHIFFESLCCFLPQSTILNISREGDHCFCVGHLLSGESMMNNAYAKNTRDDLLYVLFCVSSH